MVYVSRKEFGKFLSCTADSDVIQVPEFRPTFHNNPDLASCFIRFHQVLHSSPLSLARDTALDAMMRVIVGVLAPSVIQAGKVQQRNGRIGDAVEYLHSRVDDDVTLNELCAITGLRRRQTIEAFKRKTGLPPHAYHLLQKINAVKVMLREGSTPADAAAQTGFADQSHMTRHFVSVVGITPGAYALSAL